MPEIQGFGGLTQGFMPLAGQVAQNVDRAAELAFLNNVLSQYVSASDAATRSGGAIAMPDFGSFAQTFDPNSISSLISNLFGTGGRAIKFSPVGQEGGGQTGPTPGPMNEYASFQDFANAVASDETGLARAFGLAAGFVNPIGSFLFGAARAFGEDQTPQTFDITSAFSGGGGSSTPDPLGGFGGSPELGGRSDPSQGGPDPGEGDNSGNDGAGF